MPADMKTLPEPMRPPTPRPEDRLARRPPGGFAIGRGGRRRRPAWRSARSRGWSARPAPLISAIVQLYARHDRRCLHAAGTRRHRHRAHFRTRTRARSPSACCDSSGRSGPTGSHGRRCLPNLPDADGHAVDQVVVTYFAAPRSYTAEDVVEIACHGRPVVLRYALERACASGRAPCGAGRVHAARVSQRPHRPAASRSGSRSDRRDHALSGPHRGAAERRDRFRGG